MTNSIIEITGQYQYIPLMYPCPLSISNPALNRNPDSPRGKTARASVGLNSLRLFRSFKIWPDDKTLNDYTRKEPALTAKSTVSPTNLKVNTGSSGHIGRIRASEF